MKNKIPTCARRVALVGLALLFIVSAGCSAETPGRERIPVNLRNPTYEQVRSYENIIVAEYEGFVVSLTDMITYLLPEYYANYNEKATDFKRCQNAVTAAVEAMRTYVVAVKAGWDGSLSPAAEATFARETTLFELRLNQLSADPAEARRLYASKNLMDTEYYLAYLRRQIGMTDYLDNLRPVAEEDVRAYYEKNYAIPQKYITYYVRIHKETALERLDLVLAYLDAGGSLRDYEDMPVLSKSVSRFNNEEYDNEYTWLSEAVRGDYDWFNPERSLYYEVLEAYGNTYEDVREYVAVQLRQEMTFDERFELLPWVINMDVLEALEVNNY
jgi:hypothetical protein